MSHAARAHARLSASGSEIYLNCTMSPFLSKGLERRSSVYAEEGTKAHELAEARLRGRNGMLLDGELVDAEMDDAIVPFVKHCKDLMREAPFHKIEYRVDLADLWDGLPPDDMFGTADFVALLPNGLRGRLMSSVVPATELHVVDLKYGKHVAVEIENNTQLRYYSLGVYLSLRNLVNITHVVMTIIQPRAKHRDGPIRTERIAVVDLLTWAYEELKPTIDLICEEDVSKLSLVAGHHCRWCPAAIAKCDIKLRARAKIADEQFDDDLED